MKTQFLLATAGIVAGAAMLLLVAPGTNNASGAGAFSRVLPGLAADSAPGAAQTTTPTATPVAGGGSSSNLWVTVIISIRALELSVSPTGTTPIMIEADAKGKMPPAGQSVLIPGSFSIEDHPADVVGCSWSRVDVSTAFGVELSHTDGSSVLMGILTPEWHYIQQCPGGAPPIRYPAGVIEESLQLFLRDVMKPYLDIVANTVELPLIPASAPGCLKYYRAFSHSGIQADPAQMFVYVHEDPCPLPPLLPLPTPSATPTPGP